MTPRDDSQFMDLITEQLDRPSAQLDKVHFLSTSDLEITTDPEVFQR